MKKIDPATPTSLEDFSWEDSRFVQWISQYGRYLLWGLLALVAALTLIYGISTRGKNNAEKEYVEAESAYQEFINAEPGNAANESLALLSSILKNQPDLHAKYDGLIAQTLINRGDITAAMEYANLALARTQSEDSPFYTDYSQTTLLIAQKEYSQALARAKDLQQKMLQNPKQNEWGIVLAGYNLWRIALLQKELGLKKEELKTWQEWKKFYNDNRSPFLEQMLAAYTEGKVSLNDYVDARIEVISK